MCCVDVLLLLLFFVVVLEVVFACSCVFVFVCRCEMRVWVYDSIVRSYVCVLCMCSFVCIRGVLCVCLPEILCECVCVLFS